MPRKKGPRRGQQNVRNARRLDVVEGRSRRDIEHDLVALCQRTLGLRSSYLCIVEDDEIQDLAAGSLDRASLDNCVSRVVAHYLVGDTVASDQNVRDAQRAIAEILVAPYYRKRTIELALAVAEPIYVGRLPPEDTTRLWAVISAVTELGTGDAPLLESLGVAWYENLMDEPHYVSALIGHGISVDIAANILCHTGYMPSHLCEQLLRKLEGALPFSARSELRTRLAGAGRHSIPPSPRSRRRLRGSSRRSRPAAEDQDD